MDLISQRISLSSTIVWGQSLVSLSLSAFSLPSYFSLCKFVPLLINFAFTARSITGLDIFSEGAEIFAAFVYRLPFLHPGQPQTFLNEGLMLTQHDPHLEIY